MFKAIINKIKSFFNKSKDYKKQIIPFESVFKHVGNSLQIIPRIFVVRFEDKKHPNVIIETAKGVTTLSQGDTLGGIRWHDHIGRSFEGYVKNNHVIITGIFL